MADRIVTIASGRLRGFESDDIFEFRAIPYAGAARGERRFRPPVAPEPFVGVRDATEFGPIAPQAQSGLGSYVPGDPIEQDEDCLTLNVWTPSLGGRFPVMVFVHGGAFLAGSGSGVMYRGQHLARRGAVVVTINYRLGALGFLAHPALHDEGSGAFGNWGLFDQIAALEWVRDNIAVFGGDCANVTLFGESSGAMSVSDLLAAPRARGLFHRAVLQSGASFAASPEASGRVAERLAAALGLGGVDRASLSRVPVAELIAVQEALVAEVDGGEGMPFRPIVDRVLLPRHVADAVADGSAQGIDLLVGSNRDEYKFFSFAATGIAEIGDGDVSLLIARYLRAAGLTNDRVDADDVLAHYRAARRARGDAVTPRDLLDAVAGDWIFRIPQLRLAEAQTRYARVYAYLFDWESPFAGGALGACHALELPFVFGSLDNPIISFFAGADDEARRLSDDMQAAWVAFARCGDPSAEGPGDWPAYESTRRATMRFGRTTRVEDGPYEAERAFWNGPLGRYGVGGAIEGATPTGMALLAADEGTGT